jgi:hypothetical protein
MDGRELRGHTRCRIFKTKKLPAAARSARLVGSGNLPSSDKMRLRPTYRLARAATLVMFA